MRMVLIRSSLLVQYWASSSGISGQMHWTEEIQGWEIRKKRNRGKYKQKSADRVVKKGRWRKERHVGCRGRWMEGWTVGLRGRGELNNRGRRRELNTECEVKWKKKWKATGTALYFQFPLFYTSCLILSYPIHMAWCAPILYSWVFNSWWGGFLLGA